MSSRFVPAALAAATFALGIHCGLPVRLPSTTTAPATRAAATRPYAAHRTHVPADTARLVAAVQATAVAHALTVIACNLERGELVAVSTPDDLARTRERWTFSVGPGVVAVALRTEMDSPEGWHSPPGVCATYHYARERELLREIRRRVLASAGEPADHVE